MMSGEHQNHDSSANHSSHDHKSLIRQQNKSRLLIVLSITLTLMIVEVIVGLLTGSLALLADAGHMLSDIGGIILALIAIWFAQKPATKNKTYGYYRSEILAGLINAVVLIGIAIFILIEAGNRFVNPPEINSLPVLFVALLGLGLNFVSLSILSKGSEKSINMKAAYLEIFSDMLGLVAVLISSIIILTTKWYLADPILSGLIALMILPRTWQLLSECTHILMEGSPGHINITDLHTTIGAIAGVEDIHDLHVWTLTSDHHAMSAHVIISNDADAKSILAKVTELVEADFQLSHTTIQLETVEHHASENNTCNKDS
ncbi:MAG: cation diffusion facilitator family transporter [Candidatus Obscuribacterales bacterium]|nr:cation diffusion facilitator family transporter [Candidatus Obscuribacterales bacterium]